MHRIKPLDYVWIYTCGETDWFTGKPVLCLSCRLKEPDERPETCENEVRVDMGIKY
jgi:hypothetical protein